MGDRRSQLTRAWWVTVLAVAVAGLGVLPAQAATAPSVPTGRSVTPCWALCGEQGYTYDANPSLGAQSSGPAGTTLTYTYQVCYGWGSSPDPGRCWTATADAAPGTPATLQVPDRYTLNEAQYEYRVRACVQNTTSCSAFSSYVHFTRYRPHVGHGWPTTNGKLNAPDIYDASYHGPERSMILGAYWSDQQDGPYPGTQTLVFDHDPGNGGDSRTTGDVGLQVDGHHNLTAVVWVKPAHATGTTQALMSQRGASNSNWSLQLTADGHYRFCLAPSASSPGTVCVAAPTVAQDGQWAMVVGEYDYRTQQASIFLGPTQRTVGGSRVAPFGATGAVRLGHLVSGGALAYEFTGRMSDPVFYNDLLSPDQLATFTAGGPFVDGAAAYP